LFFFLFFVLEKVTACLHSLGAMSMQAYLTTIAGDETVKKDVLKYLLHQGIYHARGLGTSSQHSLHFTSLHRTSRRTQPRFGQKPDQRPRILWIVDGRPHATADVTQLCIVQACKVAGGA